MDKEHYDYIICGGGCAGLSLADRLCDRAFADKNILVIEKEAKDHNDRTWSFWAKEEDHRYASLYRKQWANLAFYGPQAEIVSSAEPYTYQSLRGIDFYNHIHQKMDQSNHVKVLRAAVNDIQDHGDHVIVKADGRRYRAGYAFDSIVKKMPVEDKLFVWQHFLGWEVEMDRDTFDSDTATFMDFRVEQGGETQFVYVLPFDKRRALVESTFFSKEVFDESHYQQILSDYLKTYYHEGYKVVDTECNKIPMTTAPFAKGSKRVIPIGSNNATVKPSSGYAFVRIQREADQLVKHIANGTPKKVKHSKKFITYDRTLLNVLITGKESGQDVFQMMFQKNAMPNILKFLDEDTSLMEEIRIFRTLPFWSFTKAFMEENVF